MSSFNSLIFTHMQREPTVRLLTVSHPPPLRYISVSKGGQITVWNSSLHILKTVGVSDIMGQLLHPQWKVSSSTQQAQTFFAFTSQLAGDPMEEVANTRRFRGWTTDAVYMGDVHKVAIATDCRDLHFLSVSTAGVFEEVHLFGIFDF